ncbi:MAG: DUF1566 domain-containing protein [Kiritimatiellae bacterium]|nr:DUF1566 domain-containing protein [Kiritimatiellia bacterium]
MSRHRCRGRAGRNATTGIVLASLLWGATAAAQTITSFTNGYLTFENPDPNLYYRVEYRPNLSGTDEWDGLYQRLRNIKTTDPFVCVPVGVMYRVAGRATPWPGDAVGNATPAQVLNGATFSTAAGSGLVGTMPNIGAQNVTPGATARSISAGYHNGSGTVEGDPDLVAGNIRTGFVIFGVSGSFRGIAGGTNEYDAGVPKTGQTIAYAAGDDGALERGVPWPNPRFTVLPNTNCVMDNLTGLTWARDANQFSRISWGLAITNCNDLSYGGYSDWRLPTVRELHSLVDFGQFTPSLPPDHPFNNVQMDYYWTSTTCADLSPWAWIVRFDLGYVYDDLKTITYFVWPVRGGP